VAKQKHSSDGGGGGIGGGGIGGGGSRDDPAAEDRYVKRLHWGRQYQALCTGKSSVAEKVLIAQTRLAPRILELFAQSFKSNVYWRS
jgi:hypothetical protein